METGQSTRLVKARFYSSVFAIYAATLLFLGYALKPYVWQAIGMYATPPVYQVPVQTPALESTPEQPVIKGKPARIAIPAVNIDLPVIDGIYDEASRTWTLGDTTVHYALLSAPANNMEGNTFIYGHNNNQVFAPLMQLEPNDVVYIYTDNGRKFTYTMSGSEDFKPENTSVFSYQGQPRLTIQTCVGSWYEVRRMYYFDLVDVQ